MSSKIIVTNIGQLKNKYGSNYSQITGSIQKLIDADQKRGIDTKLMGLDNSKDMTAAGGTPVKDAKDPSQNKAAVDAIFQKYRPDYLVLLGANDVVPHQDILNPVYSPGSDGDATAWSDLPYACEAAYSQDAKNFVGPTRVVGRIPDTLNGSDTSLLVKALATATDWGSSEASTYADYLGISAEVWENSTGLSLQQVFNSQTDLQLSPPKGPDWGTLISRRSHFINCHGAPSDPNFYGQQDEANYPVAHQADLLDGRITEGTVVAAECCYGAELYDPASVVNQQIGICSTYLTNKAYGFFGSTTIAYGPADGNGSADLICQYFFKRVLAGASLGRAALEARQQFASSVPELDPVDLKTLAQFLLLGDPSVQPVTLPAIHKSVNLTAALGTPKVVETMDNFERTARRRYLLAKGSEISSSQAVATRRRSVSPNSSVKRLLKALAAKNGIETPTFISYGIHRPPIKAKTTFAAAMKKVPTPTAFHVAIGKREEKGVVGKDASDKRKQGPIDVTMVVATEQGGKIVSVRKLMSR